MATSRTTDQAVESKAGNEAGTLAAVRETGPTAGESAVARLRLRGARGGIIAQHRSMRIVEMPKSEIWISIGLTIVATGIWLLALPYIMGLWKFICDSGAQMLGLPGRTLVGRYNISFVGFNLPSVSEQAWSPTATQWWVTLIVTVVMFLLSYLLMKKSVPLAYSLRAILFVQLSSLFFFAFWPTEFPYGLEDYMANLLMASLTFLSFVPLILALTYFIFDVGVLKKLFLTVLVLCHLAVLIPVQYLLHVFFIYHFSLLFMPVLYLVFGLPMDIMSLIAFYAWGMSWQSRASAQAT